METPRTQLRKNIRQKRLSYFKVRDESPRRKCPNGVSSDAHRTSTGLRGSRESDIWNSIAESEFHKLAANGHKGKDDIESMFDARLRNGKAEVSLDVDELLALDDDDDDVSELLTTHRPEHASSRFSITDSDFNSSLRESISRAVRQSMNFETANPSFTVAANLEELLGTEKYERLMRNLEDEEEKEPHEEEEEPHEEEKEPHEEKKGPHEDATPCSRESGDSNLGSETRSVLAEFLQSSKDFHSEKNSTLEDKKNSVEKYRVSDDAIDTLCDVKCAFSAEQIYSEAQKINLDAFKKCSSHETVNKSFVHELRESVDRMRQTSSSEAELWNHGDSDRISRFAKAEESFSSDFNSTVPHETAKNSLRHQQVAQPSPHSTEPTFSRTQQAPSSIPSRFEVFQSRRKPFGPTPKLAASSKESARSGCSVIESTEMSLARKGRVPKVSVSFGEETSEEEIQPEETSQMSMTDGGKPTGLGKESCGREERPFITTVDLDLHDDLEISNCVEVTSSSSARSTKHSLMKYLDEIESDMKESFDISREDDLFTRVTSVLGDVTGINFDFLKKKETATDAVGDGIEEKPNLLSTLPRPGGGVTPREVMQNAVKVCPDCAEIADIEAKFCEDCGFSLADVKPVPSKKRLDKSASYDVSAPQVNDSTEFVYDKLLCPMQSLARDVQDQLSLNLRDSRDSSVQCEPSANPNDDLSFEYVGLKQSQPPCALNELSLNLSLDHSTARENPEVCAENIAEADSFVQHLMVDPRFRPQSAQNNETSSSLPKPSKSKKRPKSASSRLYQSLNPVNYQRRWLSSGVGSSGDCAIKSKRTRPISAKSLDTRISTEGKKARPQSSGFSRALLSLSQEDLSQINDESTSHAGRSLRKSQVSPVSSALLPEPPSTEKATAKSQVLVRDGGDHLMSLPAANANYAKYFALGKSLQTKRLYSRQSPRFVVENCGQQQISSHNHEDLLQMTPRVRAGDLSMMACLPDEIVLFVFSFLNQTELGRCAVTCKQFNRIAMDCSLWQMVIVKKRLVRDDWLMQIGQRRPLSLALIQCRGDEVSPNGLRSLFRECSDSLKELNITGCQKGQLTGDHLLLHAASRCKNLTHLDASWCNINQNGLLAISDCSENLECVCINGCQSVTDEAIKSLVQKHGPHLNTLEMFGCFSITSSALDEISHHCKSLLTLNLGQCWKLSDVSISQLSASLGQVQNLDLRGCKQVRDATVRQILLNCPRLSTLAIANIPELTDESLISLASLCPGIKSLDLCGCSGVTNAGLRVLAQSAINLTYLDLSSSKATGKSVSALADFCNDHLEVVKLNFCKNISPASLKKLTRNCKRLKKLYLYGVNGVRSHLLDELRLFNPHLWIEM